MMGENEHAYFQYYPYNSLVSEIRMSGCGDFEVFLQNGEVRTFSFPVDAPYVSQYGIPLSEDGRIMYLCGWYKKEGLQARNTLTGALIWKIARNRIREIFVFRDFGAALQDGQAILKFDPYTGEVLGEIRSTSLESMYLLQDQDAFVDEFRRHCCIIDLREFKVKQVIPDRLLNPNRCLSFVVRNAEMIDGQLVISGFEGYPNAQSIREDQQDFRRVINQRQLD